MSEIIKIGILEDAAEMRDYLGYILNRTDDMQIVFSESTLAGAKLQVDGGVFPDICLVDLQLPDGNGVDFIRHVTDQHKTKCLVLTVLGDRTSVLSALEAGAHGYLLKDADETIVIKSLHQALAGANPISPEAATHLLSLFKHGQGTPIDKVQSELNSRETEVLTCFAKGLSYKETASVMELSVHTINDHVKSIYSKLRVHSKSEAIFEALQLGWIRM